MRKCGDVGGVHSDSSDGDSSEDEGDTTLRLDCVRYSLSYHLD